jgi:hypothetical protein
MATTKAMIPATKTLVGFIELLGLIGFIGFVGSIEFVGLRTFLFGGEKDRMSSNVKIP